MNVNSATLAFANPLPSSGPMHEHNLQIAAVAQL
jgi:hypothetical protein